MTAPTQPGTTLDRHGLSWLRKTTVVRRPRSKPPRTRTRNWNPTLGIRQSVLLGFMLMCSFTGAVGYYSAVKIRQSAGLVIGLFDQSLMPIDYARAAGTDFANMKTNFLRQRLATDATTLRELEDRGRELTAAFAADLGVSAQRAQSERVRNAADSVRLAVQSWQAAIKAMDPHLPLPDLLFRLDAASQSVDHEIDMLVNLTTGDGFLFREQALRSIKAETGFDIAATLAGLLLSAGVTWFLSRRIAAPISAATSRWRSRIGGATNSAAFCA